MTMAYRPQYVVGLLGAKGVGKTYVAEAMIAELTRRNLLAQHINFADALKDDLAFVLGAPRSDLDHPEYKKQYRGMMQRMGDLGRRVHGKDYWSRRWLKDVKIESDFIFVSDVRYEIEADACDFTITVFDPSYTMNTSEDTHSSEQLWKTWVPDCTYSNPKGRKVPKDLLDKVMSIQDCSYPHPHEGAAKPCR